MNNPKHNTKTTNYLLIIIVFVGFLIFGFSENIKGPAIPRMQAEFALNEINIGLMLSLNSLGYLIACSFTGYLIKRTGLKLTNTVVVDTMTLYWSIHMFSQDDVFNKNKIKGKGLNQLEFWSNL